MPFGILSLCTEGTVQTLGNYSEMMANPGPYIREAQYLTFLDLYKAGDKSIGFTSTYDLRRRWYHPQLKIPAGERITRWAIATQYGLDRSIRWKPPMVREVKVAKGHLQLRLDEPASAVDNGGPILGFAVAGEDRRFHPAKAVHYRYAWARSPLGNLQADRITDIPFATQRSDGWPMENVPLGVHAEKITEKLNRQQQRKLIEALRDQDRERILSEADALRRTADH